ncbi:TonB-dependent receptor [Stenotrophomonas terrae]|uniref:TonB-dependent receptor n=1 Tax=Stenotrophomonas terrae TaxID=405446 RepID=UPI0032078F82
MQKSFAPPRRRAAAINGISRLSLALLSAMAATQPVMAQQPATEAETATKDLDAVMVRSTHQVKPLQRTPISISVVTAEQLDRTNMSNISDLQYLAPGVSFSATAGTANGGGFQVRGIGTQAFSVASEQTVGTVVDDVVIGIPRDPGVTGFSDIEHIEVLRGPQGTLFGKNASAGVVNISTRNPEIGSNATSLSLSLGQRNEHVARVTTNLAVGDTSAFRLSAYFKEQDGSIASAFHDWNIGDQTGRGVRGKWLWSPTENLDLLLIAERQTLLNRTIAIPYTLGTDQGFNNALAGLGEVGGDNFRSLGDADAMAFQGVTGFSAKADLKLPNGAQLTSISAYRGSTVNQMHDIDQTPANFLNNNLTTIRAHQISQEFRLADRLLDERMDYVLGAYYVNVASTYEYFAYGGFNYDMPEPDSLFSLNGPKQHVDADTKSYAFYANTSYQLSDRWAASAGLRYTHDKVVAGMTPIDVATINGKPLLPMNTVLASSGQISKDNVSGKVAVQFQQTPTLMWYANAGTGYKGPTIDPTNTGSDRIQPEKSTAYEVGMKSQFLDRSLTVNASLYRSDFKDFQAQVYVPETTGFAMSNAGKMRTQGMELEINWRPTADFTVNANGAITDAEFIDYFGRCNPTSEAKCTIVDGILQGDLSGFAPTFVSKYSYSLNGIYYRSFGEGLAFNASAGWTHKSGFYNAVAQAHTKSDGYGLLNLSVGIGAEDGRWDVSVYARNVLDEHYRSLIDYGIVNTGGIMQFLSPDSFRTVGVTLSMNF